MTTTLTSNGQEIGHVTNLQYTDGHRYMREIETPKIGSHIMNSHINRPRITMN